MPRIRTVPPEAATGDLAQSYEAAQETLGAPGVPVAFQLSSIRPDLAVGLITLYGSLFRAGELPRAAKEAITTYVSALNNCPYCVGAHGLLMQLHGASAEQVDAARSGDLSAFTDDDEIARFLPLAEKITRHAYKVTDRDIEVLRTAGWSDEKILEAIWVVVFYNLVNRLADALGLAEEDFAADLERSRELLAEA